MHGRFFLAAAFVSLVCSIGIVAAQTVTSNDAVLRGTVSDPSGALIPGVKITLGNLEESGVREVVTGDRGQYSIETSAGIYQSKSEHPAFETLIVTPIQLKEDENLRMNIRIEIPIRFPRP